MTPRYQVFISSTFRDLKKERQAALDAVFGLGHFPAGMEVFPAADSTPWDLIETIINESDYYVLIIGGAYGSIDESGVSYTEKEYNYAHEKGIPVLAFLHEDPSSIPVGKSEDDPEARKKLEDFRAKVQDRHHCNFWTSPDNLQAKVLQGLTHQTRVQPRTGWIKGDTGDSTKTLKKLTDSLEENQRLKTEIQALREKFSDEPKAEDFIASGTDFVKLELTTRSDIKICSIEISWNDILKHTGSSMLTSIEAYELRYTMGTDLSKFFDRPRDSASLLGSKSLEKVLYQFMALEYVEPSSSPTGSYKLTKKGMVTLARLKAIPKDNNES